MPFGNKARAGATREDGAFISDERALTTVFDLLRTRNVLVLPWNEDAELRAHFRASIECAESQLERLQWLYPRNSQIPRSRSACRRQRTCAYA